MALDLTELNDYVDEHRDGLISQTVTSGKSQSILDVQTGFKTSGRIDTIETDVIFQDGKVCGRTPQGTTKLSGRILTVGEIKVEEDLCPKELNRIYMQKKLKAGSKDEEIPFAKEYTELKSLLISEANDIAIFQGDILSEDPNLNKFDGFIKIIDAATGVIAGNTGLETAITPANIISIVDKMEAAIPAKLVKKKDTAVLIGIEYFRMYVAALKAENLFHYSAENNEFEMIIPATSTRLIGLDALDGTDKIYGGRIGINGVYVIGVDLEHEEEDFDMWYSKDDKVVKFDVAFKMGTQIKFPEEIVEFTLSI